MNAMTQRLGLVAAAAVLILGCGASWAAKAPMSKEGLEKQARHIVFGKIISVTSKVEKPVLGGGPLDRDRVYRIIVKVMEVKKGEGIKVGDDIEVRAWTIHRRMPMTPGLQGHEGIPKKGDTATFYLPAKEGGFYVPLYPNGMAVEKAGS